MAAECLGETIALAMPGAIAIELAHNFSLVHDDIQDRDVERHGRPTVWKRNGEAQAINAGDYLYTRALKVLAQSDAPAARRIDATGALLAALDRMLQGQWTDIEFETGGDVSESRYLAMVANKTGALIGASLQVGALLAGAPSPVAESLRAWGEDLGVAFQVWDDYIGIWGDPADTGKSNATDIVRKKRTLPILLGIRAGGEVGTVIEREYQSRQPDVETVVQAMNTAGVREMVIGAAAERAERTVNDIKNLPITESARGELAMVARFFVHRDH